MGNTYTVQTVSKAVVAYANAEGRMLQFIVDHAGDCEGASEQTWVKAIAPLYKAAFEKSGRYGKASLPVMIARTKAIFLAAAHGLPVNVKGSWAYEAKVCAELIKTNGIVKATKRGTHKQVTAGKAVNTKAAVASEAREAKAKSRRQQVKVYTREQLLEAAFIVTGNSDLATLLVNATLGHRDQLSKALRAICAE